jgi:hypothetical protein
VISNLLIEARASHATYVILDHLAHNDPLVEGGPRCRHPRPRLPGTICARSRWLAAKTP